MKSVVATAHRRHRHEFRVEDISEAIFSFHSGVSAVCMANELTRYARFGIELQGTEGVLSLEYSGNQWLLGVDTTDRASTSRTPASNGLRLSSRPSLPPRRRVRSCLAVEELVHCIENGGEPSSNGEDGVASLEMVMAIYESQRQGNCPVELPLADRASQLYMLRDEGQF